MMLRSYCVQSQLRFLATRNPAGTETGHPLDLIVIGGGSGGLACAKEAAAFGKTVGVVDYVEPSPAGTAWGLGGTCVNVGCIPKKLMHNAALVKKSVQSAASYGINGVSDQSTVRWEHLVSKVQNYVKSLNWGHRVQLNERNIKYLNGFGSFLSSTEVKVALRAGEEKILTARHIVIATGLRPKYPRIRGAELGISSDDVFSLKRPPGRTLVVGASYVGLECAGFLTGLGFPTSLMVRSIPLRGFDQQMASLVLQNLETEGTRVLRGSVPTAVAKRDDKFAVTYQSGSGEEVLEEFDTVLWAIGREAKLDNLGLGNAGIRLNASTGMIEVDEYEQTSVENIHAIGDIVHDKPELTPVAIDAGKRLARRLFNDESIVMNYNNVPTTVFTPLEYACVGMSEERANEVYGEENIEVDPGSGSRQFLYNAVCDVFHAYYKPLEHIIPEQDSSQCYIKAICKREGKRLVVGLHFTGPNAGEVMQGFATAMRCGVTIEDLTHTTGIHPTCAEAVVKLNITKRSGRDPTVTGC